jgi:subtilisin family serine protease
MNSKAQHASSRAKTSTSVRSYQPTPSDAKERVMRVLIQMRASKPVVSAAFAATMPTGTIESLTSGFKGIVLDPSFVPAHVPSPKPEGGAAFSLNVSTEFDDSRQASTYIVRGTIPNRKQAKEIVERVSARSDVVGVFSDPEIGSCPTCGGDPAVGTDAVVGKLLGVPVLAGKGLTGKGVRLAVVDTGISVAHLKTTGRNPTISLSGSWTPSGVATSPGNHPIDHGTMCAFDAGIAAPKATLLDHAVLLSRTPGATAMSGLLSDAIQSYSKLRNLLTKLPMSKRRMVVSNSWGMFTPAWDFPTSDPGNYSDNPNHPFNMMVASLEHEGADILFAAGNCGTVCPDGRCGFGNTRPICGANSHPAVLSVAGVDTKKKLVGYSSQGPGRLEQRKPDVAGYTHFAGSGVYPVDSGTSAACPVVAGVVAAIRTKYSAGTLSPLQLRAFVQRTAEDSGSVTGECLPSPSA